MGTYRERPVMGPAFSMVHVLRMLRAPSIKVAIFRRSTPCRRCYCEQSFWLKPATHAEWDVFREPKCWMNRSPHAR